MNLAAIETFLAIVEAGSLTRAAERLNVSQSTVNARLNGLEDTLGQKLFSRRKSGTELTYAGFSFQRHAQLMNDVWRLARRESSLPPNTTTVCNIGCHMDLWSGLGKVFLDAITARQPDVALSAWPGEQRDMDHWLDIGLIDAAICFSPTVRDGATAHGLGDDELVLASTLALPDDYSEHIRHPAFVYADNGEEFRRQYAAAFPDTANPVITFGCAAWARDHLLFQGGAAYLPRRLLGGETALSVVDSAPVFRRMVSLVVNDRAADGWPWLPEILSHMRTHRSENP